ncbi:MAG: alpha-L-fucosidase [Clostridia bacterium]|nr:alpha-L-fucosidase [Clostridia bacterium]
MAYENNWQSLNSRPVPKWFGDAKFGIFIHWGLYSVPAYTGRGEYAEWYMQQMRNPEHPSRKFHDKTYGPHVKYEDFVSGFKAELFDANAWAKLFQKAGAKYINLVSKHHDGFCLYPSAYAWNWNSWDVGPHRDFCMELREAMEGTGVKFGVYHSVYEWFHPLYLRNPEEYALYHLHPMLKELIERYQPWTLFTDGEWDHPSDVWHSTEFLTWLYNESSVRDFIVPNDRWGRETRGHLGGNFTTEYGYISGHQKIEDIVLDRPFEECRGIGKSFGLNRIETTDDYMSAKELLETLCSLVAKGGNFLLNIGPAADGTIPVIMEERLLQMGSWLEVNGDAIYGTEIYTKEPQDGIYYTKKGEKIYAILTRFPFGSVTLDKVPYSPYRKARLLSHPADITVRENDGKTELVFPPIDPEDVRCQWLYAVELTEGN